MTAEDHVGSVAELWRFPVKSMGGERLREAEIDGGAVRGDRAYALIEKETGKVVSAKSAKLFPDLLDCRAEFLEPPRRGGVIPPVRITLPNGIWATSETDEADRALSEYFGREVTLARAAPSDFTIDQYHPDVEGADPSGRRDTTSHQKLGSAFFSEMGMDSPVPEGAFFDLFPLSLIATSTLERLGELAPQSQFDARRFRMNLTITTESDGFVENGWVGRELAIGDSVMLHVAMPDPRCVMTTLAQGNLPKDSDVLKTLAQHNRLDVGGGARFPCAGAYAVTIVTGTLRVGDPVILR